jgi:LPXTG-motif cell wall-anchored protein
MFAASAVGWYGKEETPHKNKTTPTETTPTETTPTETTPTVTTPPETPPPVEEVQPLALVDVAPAAAPAAPVAVAPAPAALPQEEVRGEAGTRDEGGSGGNGRPAVVAQADTGTEATGSPSGELAQTGLNTSVLALLGGLALAGSAALFRRARLD